MNNDNGLLKKLCIAVVIALAVCMLVVAAISYCEINEKKEAKFHSKYYNYEENMAGFRR